MMTLDDLQQNLEQRRDEADAELVDVRTDIEQRRADLARDRMPFSADGQLRTMRSRAQRLEATLTDVDAQLAEVAEAREDERRLYFATHEISFCVDSPDYSH